ncbi:MAG: type III pantothenate kinase [Pseudomonadota bacterium]
MKLLIDLGNSRCKYAVMQQDGSMEYGIQNYSPFGKLYSVKSLCDKFGDTEGVIICSVLSEKMNNEIKTTLVEKDGRDVFFLQPNENSFGIDLKYNDPSTMGADRLAALISAHEKYLGNSCIIDCGTAVTVDFLNAKGVHQGGVILPGYKTMGKALLANTKIKIKQASEGFNLLANSTEAAIYTGCVSAVVGGIEYVVNKSTSDYDAFEQIILTGGASEKVNEYFSKSFQELPLLLDANLLLDGLKVVAERT